MGKLGAMDKDTTATVIDMTAGAMPGAVANGPGDPAGWDAIDWRPGKTGTAATAEDLQGGAGRRLETGPQSAAADAAQPS